MSKPELIIYEPGGKLNADIEGVAERLEKTGSWDRHRTVMIMPAGDTVATKAALSWMNLLWPPNNGVVRILARGMEVGKAYSDAIDSVIAHPLYGTWEYILTLEHDNTPPPDGVLLLIEAMVNHPELDCISGLYNTKGYAGVPQIWGDPKDPLLNFRPQRPVANELVECCGTGMGFALWRMKMFKDERIPKPWFKTLASKEGVGTQDLAFWTEARKWGHRCAVDCRVKVGHLDLTGEFGLPDFEW